MTAIIGSNTSILTKNALSDLGYDIISIPRFERLPSPIASHPDSLFFLTDDVLITHKDYYDVAKHRIDRISEITDTNIILSSEAVDSCYPHDVLFNAVFLNDKIICNITTISSRILEYAKERNIDIINVKQGYAKCSTLVVDNSSIITSDLGIHSAAVKNGICSLLIEGGNIDIDEYDYGFIGGTAGVTEQTVYFNGRIANHPSYADIKDFCEARGKNIVQLTDTKLLDIGTIFFI